MHKNIKEYISQLQKTHSLELYHFTLMGTLALIDICAAINSPNGETSGRKFKNWYEKYLSEYLPENAFNGMPVGLSANECYKFRCRLLHQGQAKIDTEDNQETKTGRIVFVFYGGTMHRCNANGDYILDAETFMNDVIKAVKEWYEENKEDSHVFSNCENLLGFKNTFSNPAIGFQGTPKFLY